MRGYVSRLSQFARLALRVYGTVGALVSKLGFTRHKAQQYKKQLESMNAAMSEDSQS